MFFSTENELDSKNYQFSIINFQLFLLSLPPKLVIEHIDARESGANPELYLQL